jgi:hypothetical protein
MQRNPASRRHFSEALLAPEAVDGAEPLPLSAISAMLGNGAIGTLLLFLALPMVLPIPAPGISVIFGVPLVLLSAQLLFGGQFLWLPDSVAKRIISREHLQVYIGKALPMAQRIEKMVRPRWPALTHGVSLNLIGGLCLVLALIITLPVPLGHLVPGAAISLMAFGLIESDGLMVAAGFLTGIIALLVVALAVTGLVTVGHGMLSI